MEKFIQEKRLGAMAIGTQWLHEFRQSQVQALEVLGTPFGTLLMHIVAGWAADIADPSMA